MSVHKKRKRKKDERPCYLEELEVFFRERVGAQADRVSCKTLSPKALKSCLEVGFCNGDLKALLRTCRDPNNVELDEEDIDDMIEALHENGTTINEPFCFAPGAVAIKQMLVSNRLVQHENVEYYTHDIEVGIYASKNVKKDGKENDFAEWHWDENLNYTIQLSGEKEWKTSRGEANPLSSGMNLTSPRNAHERKRNFNRKLHRYTFKYGYSRRTNKQDLSPHEDDIKSERLKPGMMIRVSPGEWHRVESCETGRKNQVTISINIRLAHVTPARWAAECIFSALASKLYGSYKDVCTQMINDSELKSSASFDSHMNFCASASFIADAKRKCPLLRILPFDAKLSNGLVLGNTASNLLAYAENASIKKTASSMLSEGIEVKIFANRLCAIQFTDFSEIGCKYKKFENMACMKISSTSTLTNFDYINTFYIVLDDEDFDTGLRQCFRDQLVILDDDYYYYEDEVENSEDEEKKSEIEEEIDANEACNIIRLGDRHFREKCARLLDVFVDHGIAVALPQRSVDAARDYCSAIVEH
jgi:hypothetical protein